MLEQLYLYWFELFAFIDNEIPFTNMTFEFGNDVMTFCEWLSLVASLISLIIIVVLCCLFVYKIIKLIGGLIR